MRRMSRLFALAALIAALVVTVTMIAGLRAVAASVTVGVHVLSVVVLRMFERRIGGRGAFAGLAERNRRRVSWLVIFGGAAILAAALFPASGLSLASLAFASAATSFNLGVFAVETVSISAQWRLLREQSAAPVQ